MHYTISSANRALQSTQTALLKVLSDTIADIYSRRIVFIVLLLDTEMLKKTLQIECYLS